MDPEKVERGDFVEEEEVVEEEVVEEEGVVEEEDQPGDVAPDEDEEAPITIPKARFDEAQRKARERQQELERRINEMEKKTVVETTRTDFSKLEDEIEDLNTKFEDLLLEGEVDKARVVRRQRDQKQNEMFDMRLAQTSQATGSAAVEQMRFDAQLAQFEAKYPAINPDSDSFNGEMVAEVNEMLQVYKAAGYTLAASLNKAIHYVVRDEGSPAVSEDPSILRSKRGQQARKKVLSAIKKMPPDLTGKGRDSGKTGRDDGLPDVTRMTPEQFDKLSKEDLIALRADRLSDEEAA